MPSRENERALNEFSNIRYCARCKQWFPVGYWNGGHPFHREPIIREVYRRVSAEQWQSITDMIESAPSKKMPSKSQPRENLLDYHHENGHYITSNSTKAESLSSIVAFILALSCLCIVGLSWYPYLYFDNGWWLALSIPVSLMGVPLALIWLSHTLSREK